MIIALNATSGFLAFVAAIFWYQSSRIGWPNAVTIDGGDFDGNGGGMPEVEEWSRKISIANARGATAAALSALTMAAATLLPLILGS